MTREEIELSTFLNVPVADGLDAVEETLALFRSSKGETRKQARKILSALRLTFSQLAPRTTSATHWDELRRQIVREIG